MPFLTDKSVTTALEDGRQEDYLTNSHEELAYLSLDFFHKQEICQLYMFW